MNRLPRYVEWLLLAVGGTLLAGVAVAMAHRSIASQQALAEFDRAQAAALQTKQGSVSTAPAAAAPAAIALAAEEPVDVSLWSTKRVREYRASLLIKKDAPLAVLAIARLKIRVPVFEGTDDLVLNRGVGWIAGTSAPGEQGTGNIGIAGHRDGFFRPLKDVAIGDDVELSTLGLVRHYAVDSTEIVQPEDVGVLNPRGTASVTLVTCYPFYFIGDAPQRFIVHARLKQ